MFQVVITYLDGAIENTNILIKEYTTELDRLISKGGVGEIRIVAVD